MAGDVPWRFNVAILKNSWLLTLSKRSLPILKAPPFVNGPGHVCPSCGAVCPAWALQRADSCQRADGASGHLLGPKVDGQNLRSGLSRQLFLSVPRFGYGSQALESQVQLRQSSLPETPSVLGASCLGGGFDHPNRSMRLA